MLAHLLCCKGQSLRYLSGWCNQHFVALYVGEGSEREKSCLLGSCHLSSHFPHFPLVTGALPAAALVLIPWVGGIAYVLGPCGPFLNGLSRETGSFFCHPSPHWFLQPEVMRLYFPGTGTLTCLVWSGAGIAVSPVVPLVFTHCMWMWDHSFLQPPSPHCTTLCPFSPSYPSIWMFLL